jgi:hypothetical protein
LFEPVVLATPAESAKAAFTWGGSHWKELGLKENYPKY